MTLGPYDEDADVYRASLRAELDAMGLPDVPTNDHGSWRLADYMALRWMGDAGWVIDAEDRARISRDAARELLLCLPEPVPPDPPAANPLTIGDFHSALKKYYP